MNILYAKYGGVDCTDIIKSRVINNKIILRVNNNIIGDPKPGILKELVINIDNEVLVIKEGDLLIYPKSENKKLGIFYSNNNNIKIYSSIRSSLESIKKSATDVDILTCVWNKVDNNPFPEYISHYKNSSHLNQLLQILQLLYTAKEIKEYEYVSFLEHDVMYPEGYFDYPDINEGEVITNFNYIGLCKDGWQEVPIKHEPFHQMTMKFDDAIKHCESILPNALVTNSGLIEPQVPNIIRRKWNCINPSVHINHGYHFTSHYSIYSKDRIFKTDKYWGDFTNYLDLF